MLQSQVAVLLFGLAVIYAQADDKPNTVVVKKFYGNAAPTPAARLAVPYTAQPYPYYQNGQYYQSGQYYPGQYNAQYNAGQYYPGQYYPYNGYYNQNYYNQYQYRGQYPYYNGASPSPVSVYASPAPPPAPISPIVPVSPAPFGKSPIVGYGAPKSGVPDKEARVLSEERNVDFDGTFKYAYQTDNGIAVNAEGFVKQPTPESEGPIQVIQGSYASYTPEGVPVQISYIADENGFRASGDAIPTPYPELSQAYANAPIERQK